MLRITKLYIPFFALVLGAFQVGCGFSPVLKPAQVASIRRTVVQSHIPQREITAQWVAIDSGVSPFGVVGGVIQGIGEGIANVRRAEATERLVWPLREQSQGIDFRTSLWNSMEPVLYRASWLKADGLERVEREPRLPAPEDVAKTSILRITSGVSLSPNCATLAIATELKFFAQGRSGGSVATVLLIYRSTPVPQADTKEKAVALWAENRASRYAHAVEEGVRENAKMMDLALLCMGGQTCASTKPHHVRFRISENEEETNSGARIVENDGAIVQESPDRLLFRAEEGTFYSVPRSTVENQIGHGPPPAAVVPVAPPASEGAPKAG